VCGRGNSSVPTNSQQNKLSYRKVRQLYMERPKLEVCEIEAGESLNPKFDEDQLLTPFLKNTFEMVEDLSTDVIVSWSFGRNSFVVWDLQKFSDILLPRYFKHKNFTSFTRQLNCYVISSLTSALLFIHLNYISMYICVRCRGLRKFGLKGGSLQMNFS